ncbi:MAG: hypothetical protein QNK37_10185 [Acidobacteriota bacterium]|nr:hypothetical protein [Acidobacteriota bacterium]
MFFLSILAFGIQFDRLSLEELDIFQPNHVQIYKVSQNYLISNDLDHRLVLIDSKGKVVKNRVRGPENFSSNAFWA